MLYLLTYKYKPTESAKGDIDAFGKAEEDLMTIEANLRSAEEVPIPVTWFFFLLVVRVYHIILFQITWFGLESLCVQEKKYYEGIMSKEVLEVKNAEAQYHNLNEKREVLLLSSLAITNFKFFWLRKYLGFF